MRIWVAVLAFLFLLAVALVLLSLLGLLQLIIFLIGLIVFLAILAAIVVTGLVFIAAIPYYMVAKRSQVIPGKYELEQVKGK